MTINDGPRPKLRVTTRRCTPVRPHAAQRGLVGVDGEDEEIAVRGDLNDGFRGGRLSVGPRTTYLISRVCRSCCAQRLRP